MRHSRCEIRGGARAWTSRRLAAAQAAVDRETLDFFPRFRSVEERQAQVDAAEARWSAAFRSHHAGMWLRARAAIRALPAGERAAILTSWNRGHLPGSPEYLLNLIRYSPRHDQLPAP